MKSAWPFWCVGVEKRYNGSSGLRQSTFLGLIMRSKFGQQPMPEDFSDGRYTVDSLLGVGGMASVYRVMDHWSGEERALKVLRQIPSRSERTRTRFIQEARTMRSLDHPNVVRISDVHAEGPKYFFTMELCNESLAGRLRARGPMTGVDAARYGIGVLRGLEHAHRAGVVHRDVKPHNMLIGLDGTVKLTDFGIARILDKGQQSRITGTGDTLGTIAYMAPEQRIDARAATPAADIFSVGATMYVLLTGRRPFDLAMSGLNKSVLEKVPPELRSVIRRSTAHRPEDRYVTAGDMANRLVEADRSAALEGV